MSSFWIILVGSLVASACSVLGCFLILRRMAMIGDAISHAVLPGIVVAFLISESRQFLPMLVGAAIFGLLTTVIIQRLQQNQVQTDAAISVTFTAFFAIGVVLISLFARQVHLDLDHVLYGEIAYVQWDTWYQIPRAVWIVGTALMINLLLIAVFYKQFKLCAFDPLLAAAMGIPVAFFHYLLMGMVSITTVVSFESVGAILVVAMLVVPGATAYLWTDQLHRMLTLSILFGIQSAIGGYFLATWLDASIAGAMAVVTGILFALSFLFAPRYGLLTRWWRIRQS